MSTNLPPEFWAARPVLTHIQQAAQAGRVSPDAVLGTILARVAASTPPAFRLPATIGAPVTVSFYSVILGASGTGKSAATGCAEELFALDEDLVIPVKVGTGEGLVESYLDLGNNNEQIFEGAYLEIDEGEFLAKISARSGSTLSPTLREMWNGKRVGNNNVGSNKRRLKKGEYVLGIAMGLQPKLAKDLLDGEDAGDPQRYVWFSAVDPNRPLTRPTWPGPLRWTRPALTSATGHSSLLDVDPAILQEIDDRHGLILAGELVPDPLDSHADLCRLKVAALLAILEGRLAVTMEDWFWAGIVMEVSTAVRTHAKNVINEAKAQSDANSRLQGVKRALDVSEALANKEEARVAEVMNRLIERLKVNLAEAGGVMSSRDVDRMFSSSDRKLGLRPRDLIYQAEERGLVEVRHEGQARNIYQLESSGQ